MEVDLWEEPQLVFVLAGKNKASERQLFLSTFDDCDLWSISVVPSVMSLEKAHRLIGLATTKLSDKKVKVPEFEIVPIGTFPELARVLGYTNLKE